MKFHQFLLFQMQMNSIKNLSIFYFSFLHTMRFLKILKMCFSTILWILKIGLLWLRILSSFFVKKVYFDFLGTYYGFFIGKKAKTKMSLMYNEWWQGDWLSSTMLCMDDSGGLIVVKCMSQGLFDQFASWIPPWAILPLCLGWTCHSW